LVPKSEFLLAVAIVLIVESSLLAANKVPLKGVPYHGDIALTPARERS